MTFQQHITRTRAKTTFGIGKKKYPTISKGKAEMATKVSEIHKQCCYLTGYMSLLVTGLASLRKYYNLFSVRNSTLCHHE